MRASWKAGGIAVALTLVSVALAYQVPTVVEIDLSASFPGALAIDNFHDQEPGYRWTRAASSIVFHDPGGRQDATLELELAGFRPPGTPPPLVVVEAGGRTTRLAPGRRVGAYAIDIRTAGWWSSDLDVAIRSETFTAGAGDERALGVRVHRARLALPGGAIPPLKQLLLSGALVALAFAWWRERRFAVGATLVLAGAVATGYALARGSTVLIVPAAVVMLAALGLVRWWLPSLTTFASEVLAAAGRALAASVAHLAHRRTAVLVAAVMIAATVSFLATPRVSIDLGTDEASTRARRFGPLDRDGDVTFQVARAGATLDVSDFGTGRPWTVVAHVSASNQKRGVIVSSNDRSTTGELDRHWSRHTLELPAPPFGWSSGPVLTFPGLGGGSELRVARIEIDRGASLPSLRPLALAAVATLLVAGALGSTLAGAAFGALVVAGFAVAPVVTIPLLPTLVVGAGASLAVGSVARGVIAVSQQRDFLPELSPAATSIALFGFLLWFAALASPLYVGGHYAFHTNIVEEISRGHFLLYYLPYPGSMLSRQPQWDNLIVPHSCLFHTVAAPLALLPRVWFHLATKLFLASLLFGIATASALVATRITTARAGVYAALAAISVPTGFQLLGLGHLMTLFGTWAAALALGFVIVHADDLHQRAVFYGAVALVSLCFVSYTGSLLFASIVLVVTCLVWFRRHRGLSLRLATVVVIAWVAAFLLYYVHWTLPFVSDTLPALLSSGGDGGIDVLGRIASQPQKLAYTFGSAVVPLVGLGGLALARGERRALLWSWGGILVVFSALDVFFNFLLKHHYFAFPAVAIGIGLTLARLHEKNPIWRAISVIFVVSIVWMGFREALAVARGAY